MLSYKHVISHFNVRGQQFSWHPPALCLFPLILSPGKKKKEKKKHPGCFSCHLLRLANKSNTIKMLNYVFFMIMMGDCNHCCRQPSGGPLRLCSLPVYLLVHHFLSWGNGDVVNFITEPSCWFLPWDHLSQLKADSSNSFINCKNWFSS